MSVLGCAYGTRVSATREGAERIDESCELRVSCPLRCRVVEIVGDAIRLQDAGRVDGSEPLRSRGSSTAGERVTPIIRYLRRIPVRRPHIAPARPLRVRRPTDRRLRASPARGVQGPPRSNVHATRRRETAERVGK